MQEMSENFIDSFGFQDDEFTDSDMNVRLVFDLSFDLFFALFKH